MDFKAILLGRYLLELFGALLRYTFINIRCLIGINDYKPFSNIWSEKGNIDKKNGSSEMNHMIGVIFFGIIIVLMIIFMT